MLAVLAGAAGCQQNPNVALQQQQLMQQQYMAQLQDMQRRAGQLDANNSDLHVQIAQSQQQTQLLRDQVALLQKQLGDAAQQLREVQVARQQAEARVAESEQRLASLQRTVTSRGGAVITANNSLQRSLQTVSIPGVEVRADGDVIRIELPADQLFVRGSAQLQPAGYQLLDQAADALLRHYPQQIIVIEGHTDSTLMAGSRYTSLHSLSAAQATAVHEQLTSRHRLNPGQLRIMGQGPAQPLASNGSAAGQAKNRRIELVVYPEAFAAR